MQISPACGPMRAVKALFLENHDSFSWNVVDALPFPRDEIRLIEGSACTRADLASADLLVIGPGPTDPIRAGLVGLVGLAADLRLPTLGICLGHQAIGIAFGAKLRRVPPVHGKCSSVRFEPSRSFPGIEGELLAMRYHSLALDGIAPPLLTLASTADGIVMAVEHATLPIAGLQFHPDSYATPRGREILDAFFRGLR